MDVRDGRVREESGGRAVLGSVVLPLPICDRLGVFEAVLNADGRFAEKFGSPVGSILVELVARVVQVDPDQQDAGANEQEGHRNVHDRTHGAVGAHPFHTPTSSVPPRTAPGLVATAMGRVATPASAGGPQLATLDRIAIRLPVSSEQRVSDDGLTAVIDDRHLHVDVPSVRERFRLDQSLRVS